ncbi:hypothetical protein THIOM_004866 [Candidatus Thiomargarita nelsonii]|uniref:Uncharacterized protein n=1 Tax=Candidatus Thiomargarita nelsonii TaxID=1003181 RepID=A0A176RUU8_9GAMM|nr:hypothetical protein THIOM_004866 [Candidatus Thiomargarita nelsonii]
MTPYHSATKPPRECLTSPPLRIWRIDLSLFNCRVDTLSLNPPDSSVNIGGYAIA